MSMPPGGNPAPGRARQRGFTWLEFSIVAMLLSTLAGSLLTALLYYEEMGEAAVVQLTVQNARSGLRYQIADKLVSHRAREIGELLTANPFSWMESAPAGYVGPVRSSDIRSLPKGSWFYDIDLGEMGYIPERSFHLDVEASDDSILRWRVTALKVGPRGETEGLNLVAVTPYSWF